MGFYCPAGVTVPVECPASTYRARPGGGSVADCALCTGGFACPSRAMSQPVPCPEAAYCPVNSTFPLPCPPGMYCSFASEAPTLCPASHYCPGNTSAPLACPQYRYCPPGSILPFACPRGLRALPDTNAVTRSTFDDACEYCPQGTYNDMPGSPLCRPVSVWARGMELLCCCECRGVTRFPSLLVTPLQCPAGYVCLGATGTSAPLDRIADLGYRCEVGYYCPEGSSEQRACPPGTANPAVGATNASACAPCPASTFQEQPGQGSCRSCGATAYSLPGATTCSCYGKSRDYQITDGAWPPLSVVMNRARWHLLVSLIALLLLDSPPCRVVPVPQRV